MRIPTMPITDSDACRSPIPTHADHRFQTMPITPERDDAGLLTSPDLVAFLRVVYTSPSADRVARQSERSERRRPVRSPELATAPLTTSPSFSGSTLR